MQKSKVDMLSGPITKGLLSLMIPIMVMNVMQSLFNIVDMTVLRVFANDTAVGAVGACGTLITLCTSLLIGISVGANVIVAKRIGSQDRERADRAATTSVVIAIAGGVSLMIIGVVFARSFLELINCPDELIGPATLYFKVYFLAMPFQMMYNFSASILRATGDTKKPMYFLIIGGIIKVICSLVFVAGFNTTVVGVGFATFVSNAVIMYLAFSALIKKKDIITISFKKFGFDFSEFKDIVFIGIPAGIQNSMYSLANTLIATVVNSYGADATTGISIAGYFDGIMYQIIYAPSLATTPYIAQNIGAGNIKRVKQTFLRSVMITVIIGASLGSLTAIFSGELSSVMTSTPAVIAYSQQKMILISSTYFICGINEIICGVLMGMGKQLFTTCSTFVYICLLRFFWVYVIYPLCPSLMFLYAVWPIGWTLSVITLLIVYFKSLPKIERKLQ